MLTTGSLYLSSADAEPSKQTESKLDILIVWDCVYFFVVGLSFTTYISIIPLPLMDFVVRKFNAIKFFGTS